jgi:hypothetical protein
MRVAERIAYHIRYESALLGHDLFLCGTKLLGLILDPGGFWRNEAQLDFKLFQRLIGQYLIRRLLTLDIYNPFARQIGGDAHFGAIQTDLVLDDLFDLTEVGGDVEIE